MKEESILREISHLPSEIHEIRIRNKKNIIASLLMGFILMATSVLILALVEMNYMQRVATAIILVLIYFAVLFFMLEPKIIREVHHRSVHHYEKPVIKEVEKEIIVEKPVPVLHEVEKKVLIPIEKREKELDFIGSSETKIYHHKSCRFAGMIKPQYRVEHDDLLFFRATGYKPCQVCILKKKKV